MGSGGYDFFTAFEKQMTKGIDRSLDQQDQLDTLMQVLGIKEGYTQRREAEEVEGYKTALEQRDPGRLGAFGTDPGAYEGVTLDPLKMILQGEMDTDKFRAKEEYKTGKKEDVYEADEARLGKIYPKASPEELRMAARSPTFLAQLTEKYGQTTPGETKTTMQIRNAEARERVQRRLYREYPNFGGLELEIREQMIEEGVNYDTDKLPWYPKDPKTMEKGTSRLGRGFKPTAAPPPVDPNANAGGGGGGGGGGGEEQEPSLLQQGLDFISPFLGLGSQGPSPVGPQEQPSQGPAPAGPGGATQAGAPVVNTRPDIPIGTPKHHPNGAISKWDGKGWALDKPAPNAGGVQ